MATAQLVEDTLRFLRFHASFHGARKSEDRGRICRDVERFEVVEDVCASLIRMVRQFRWAISTSDRAFPMRGHCIFHRPTGNVPGEQTIDHMAMKPSSRDPEIGQISAHFGLSRLR